MGDVTVLIAHKRGAREDWLKDAIGSIPVGTPYMVLENDGDLADALNAGLKEAKTEYVIRLDDDDLLGDGLIEALEAAIWDVDVAYPSLVLTDEELKVKGAFTASEFCPNRLQVWNFVPGAGALFRREAALAVGGYRELDAWEDWDLWVRMSRAGYRFKALPMARYFYRQSSTSRNKITAETEQKLKQQILGEPIDLLGTYYVQETTATTYWRALVPGKYLPAQVVAHRPVVQTDGDDFSFPHHRGTAIFQFPGHEYERFAMAALQEVGVKVLVETDDNYLTTIPYGKKWIQGMPAQSDLHPLPSIELHKRIVQKCIDGVIVSTDHLAKQYRKFTDKPVYVCPNQIEPSDWDEPEKTDKLVVGWSGSASHLSDMRLVGKALEWASKQPGVEVMIFGFLPKSFAGRFRFRHVPWTSDLGAYRKILGQIDIGLAPIIENPWSVARSDLKSLEYAMSGACPVLSEAIPYQGWTDGEFCRKAKTTHDFFHVVRDLVRNPELAKELAAAAKEHVLAERTAEKNIDRWREAIAA